MRKIILMYLMLISTALPLGIINVDETETLPTLEDISITIPETETMKMETVVEVMEVMEIEPIEIQPTEPPKAKEYRYIDCPLSQELQQGIFDICEEYCISFEFVMSVIAQESSFDIDALGDNGNSKGLMQIQEKWHYELMEDLGVTDLYEPLDNVKVGVALLTSYLEENEDVYYVLMRYNGGNAYAKKMIQNGKTSAYANEIVERSMQYETENE